MEHSQESWPGITLCFDVPFGSGEGRARLEILFDTPRPLDNWSCQIIEAATHLAALILELERATGRLVVGAVRRQGDGAAPLIGSSEAIRRVRERIERVAATDFTILIEGESGPEPHPIFIGLFCGAPVSDGYPTVARAGEEVAASLRACLSQALDESNEPGPHPPALNATGFRGSAASSPRAGMEKEEGSNPTRRAEHAGPAPVPDTRQGGRGSRRLGARPASIVFAMSPVAEVRPTTEVSASRSQ